MRAVAGLLIGISILSGCTTSRYQHAQDFTPQTIPDISTIPEPTPKAEPLSALGNPSSYRVWGKEYQVLPTAAGYHERGVASWYGMKFHGHRTANGEIYDVYQYTAAHKTLPLPSYVRVTRVDTGQSVVVRVNDRGPFHNGRIIDLSYAAAVKLGINRKGTAEVDVEVVQPPASAPVRWIQVSALSDLNAARNLQHKLQQNLVPLNWPVSISSPEQNATGQKVLHKVRIGPVPEGDQLTAVLERLKSISINNPLLLAAHQL